MGMFSSKKKHFVDTSVVRLVTDDLIPSVVTTALITSLFSDQTISNALKNEMASGGHRNFEQMFRFAERGDYTYGLPNARVIGSSAGNALAQGQLEAELGGPVVLDYLHFRPLNNTHAAWKHLFEAYGYAEASNEITSLSAVKGTEVYLTKIVATHAWSQLRRPEQSSVGEFGVSPSANLSPISPGWADPSALEDLLVSQEVKYSSTGDESAEIHYAWFENDVNGVAQLQEEFFVYDLAAFDTDQEYYQARYTYQGAVGYWTYDPLTGSNTALNAVFRSGDFIGGGRYFPFAVFRAEGQNRATDALKSTEAYQSTEKLLEYLGIDFREMADSMHEDANIADVDQAVLMMAVPIDAENKAEIDYLYRYFSDLYASLPEDGRQVIDYSDLPDRESMYGASPGGTRTSYAVDISDADFRTTLSFEAIEVRLKAGTIGEIGALTNTTTELSPTGVVAQAADSELAVATARIFRKQITDTIYEEIKVIGPKMRYHIYLDKGAEGSAEDGRILIPIEYDVAKSVEGLKRQELYYRSLHLVFNSHVEQTIKWYERGAFAILLVIIAVVITVMTYGKTWKALVATVGNGAVTQAVVVAFLKVILVNLVGGFVVTAVFEEIAEELGPEVAFWLAATIAAVGIHSKIAGNKVPILNIEADKVLAAAIGLAQGSVKAIGGLYDDLLKEQESFLLESEKLQEELDKASALLDTNNALSPYSFLNRQPLSLFGEPPEAYYERTVHLGNPGAEAIQISQNFIKNSLRLPTFDQTVGDLSNG
jgi:hypothetical protein